MRNGGGLAYLVTGGSGFIGSHLVEALLARGDSVIALDNLSTGRLSNLENVRSHPRLRFFHGSVLDELIVDELTHQCDVVIHLAGAVGVKLIVEHPLRSLTTNIRGSEIVIEAAHRYRRKVLLASTSEIYGKNSTGPLHEESERILGSPAVVRWAYSTSKAVDEILANAYHRERGLPTIVVRLFNTVGPRQSPAYGMVIPRLIRQALRGEPVTVFGNGRQTRCFAHVADVIEALLLLIDDEAAVGQTFNVGSSDEISILDLARLIIARCNSGSAIELIPYDQAYESGFEDMDRRVPDTAKLHSRTGWVAENTLAEILNEMIREAVSEMGEIPSPRSAAGPTTPGALVTGPGTVIAAGVLAFVLVAVLTGAMRRIAIRFRLVDQPRADRVHIIATPYLGGIAISGGTVAAVAGVAHPGESQTLAIIIAGAAISLLGLIDDLRRLSQAVRLVTECLAAAALVIVGIHIDMFARLPMVGGWIDAFGTVVWIVVITNSFNLLDNMDGAAAAIAFVSPPILAVLALATGRQDVAALLVALSAGCAGFLVHNWTPARIFMGDAGSLFLGFVIASATVLICSTGDSTNTSIAAVAGALLLMTFVPVVDTCTVMHLPEASRSPMEPWGDRSHCAPTAGNWSENITGRSPAVFDHGRNYGARVIGSRWYSAGR